MSCRQMCSAFVDLWRVAAAAASASVLFGAAPGTLCLCLCVSVCVFVFCSADVHQIKAAEHHNWLLQHHFSDVRLAAERQTHRQSPASQTGGLTLSLTRLIWV